MFVKAYLDSVVLMAPKSRMRNLHNRLKKKGKFATLLEWNRTVREFRQIISRYSPLAFLTNVHGDYPNAAKALYTNGRLKESALARAFEVAQKYLNENAFAVQCGDRPQGQPNLLSGLWALLTMKNIHALRGGYPGSDSFTTFSSCTKGFDTSKFRSYPFSRFYRSSANYFGATLNEADSPTDMTLQPIKWLDHQTKWAAYLRHH